MVRKRKVHEDEVYEKNSDNSFICMFACVMLFDNGISDKWGYILF